MKYNFEYWKELEKEMLKDYPKGLGNLEILNEYEEVENEQEKRKQGLKVCDDFILFEIITKNGRKKKPININKIEIFSQKKKNIISLEAFEIISNILEYKQKYKNSLYVRMKQLINAIEKERNTETKKENYCEITRFLIKKDSGKEITEFPIGNYDKISEDMIAHSNDFEKILVRLFFDKLKKDYPEAKKEDLLFKAQEKVNSKKRRLLHETIEGNMTKELLEKELETDIEINDMYIEDLIRTSQEFNEDIDNILEYITVNRIKVLMQENYRILEESKIMYLIENKELNEEEKEKEILEVIKYTQLTMSSKENIINLYNLQQYTEVEKALNSERAEEILKKEDIKNYKKQIKKEIRKTKKIMSKNKNER